MFPRSTASRDPRSRPHATYTRSVASAHTARSAASSRSAATEGAAAIRGAAPGDRGGGGGGGDARNAHSGYPSLKLCPLCSKRSYNNTSVCSCGFNFRVAKTAKLGHLGKGQGQ